MNTESYEERCGRVTNEIRRVIDKEEGITKLEVLVILTTLCGDFCETVEKTPREVMDQIRECLESATTEEPQEVH